VSNCGFTFFFCLEWWLNDDAVRLSCYDFYIHPFTDKIRIYDKFWYRMMGHVYERFVHKNFGVKIMKKYVKTSHLPTAEIDMIFPTVWFPITASDLENYLRNWTPHIASYRYTSTVMLVVAAHLHLPACGPAWTAWICWSHSRWNTRHSKWTVHQLHHDDIYNLTHSPQASSH